MQRIEIYKRQCFFWFQQIRINIKNSLSIITKTIFYRLKAILLTQVIAKELWDFYSKSNFSRIALALLIR